MEYPVIVEKLINSYVTLVLAYETETFGGKSIDEVPVEFKYNNETYELRKIVEVEVANELISKIEEIE